MVEMPPTLFKPQSKEFRTQDQADRGSKDLTHPFKNRLRIFAALFELATGQDVNDQRYYQGNDNSRYQAQLNSFVDEGRKDDQQYQREASEERHSRRDRRLQGLYPHPSSRHLCPQLLL